MTLRIQVTLSCDSEHGCNATEVALLPRKMLMADMSSLNAAMPGRWVAAPNGVFCDDCSYLQDWTGKDGGALDRGH